MQMARCARHLHGNFLRFPLYANGSLRSPEVRFPETVLRYIIPRLCTRPKILRAFASLTFKILPRLCAYALRQISFPCSTSYSFASLALMSSALPNLPAPRPQSYIGIQFLLSVNFFKYIDCQILKIDFW